MAMLIIKRSVKAIAALLCLSALSACGGGGGESSTNTPAPAPPAPAPVEAVDYTPDTAALDESANKSTELYVETDFNFDTFKVVTLDINATGANGQALSNTLIFISVIDSEITELDDERLQHKALLTVAKTDANGNMYRQVETASTVTKLLVELNTIGIENEVILEMPSDNYVSYRFQ